jgi:hypothetical protein
MATPKAIKPTMQITAIVLVLLKIDIIEINYIIKKLKFNLKNRNLLKNMD